MINNFRLVIKVSLFVRCSVDKTIMAILVGEHPELSTCEGCLYIYQIVLPLSDSMSVSTFSKFL